MAWSRLPRRLAEAMTSHNPMRRSAKRHALHTESSHRFERGTDVSAVTEVIDRAAALIVEVGGGTVLKGRVDAYPVKKQPRQVKLRTERVAETAAVTSR